MMDRTIKILLSSAAILAVALLAGLWYLENKKAAVPIAEETYTKSENDVKEFVEIPVAKDETITEADGTRHYTVNVSYPSIALLDHPDYGKDASAVIRSYVDDTIAKFKEDVDGNAEQVKDTSSDLTMRWSALLLSPTIISIRFDRSEYIAGAAHPGGGTDILNYDMEKKTALQASDLFASSTFALPFLASTTRAKLKDQFSDISSEEWSNEVLPGTEPKAENFSATGLTEDGLIVVFQPYQVAPYARGTPEVKVPLAETGGLLSERILDALRLAKENISEATPEGAQGTSQNEVNP